MLILTEKELPEPFSFSRNRQQEATIYDLSQPGEDSSHQTGAGKLHSHYQPVLQQPLSSYLLILFFSVKYYAVCFIKLQTIILGWVVTRHISVQSNVHLSHSTLELRCIMVILTTVRRTTLPWQKLLRNPITVNESPFNFLILDCRLFKNYWHSNNYAFLDEGKRILEIYSIPKDTWDFITTHLQQPGKYFTSPSLNWHLDGWTHR